MMETDPCRKNIKKLLEMNLDIPTYQRPYKWDRRNMADLLNDIGTALGDAVYRIGTIILHKNADKLDIVDGQQRIISLVLLARYLEPSFDCSILKKGFTNKVSQANIQDNYRFITEWFSLKKDDEKEKYRDALENVLEVVVITVDKVTEAFQLFDSQNTRGKELDPHDLLKAYHLREMKNEPYEMERVVTKWEAKKIDAIRSLFRDYLFPVWNWSRRQKSRAFTVKEIDIYKGITENKGYTYAKRAGRAMPHFQMNEPFLAGNDFFEMVDHYLWLLQVVKSEIHNDSEHSNFKCLKEILENTDANRSVGFGYVKELFYCAVLFYYDRFHNFDELAIRKMFTWAFMLRVDMKNLGYDSVNKYAVGEAHFRYTNTSTPVFALISEKRLHTDIAGLPIKVMGGNKNDTNKKWEKLYKKLEGMNGIKEVSE